MTALGTADVPTAAATRRGARRARRRDRRVYLESHPLLLVLLALARRSPVLSLGRVTVVTGTAAYREALTRLPLDRTAPGTTGGAAVRTLDGEGLLFDQDGVGHRSTRRDVARWFDAESVERLRPTWAPLVAEAADRLGAGGTVDVVDLACRMAGSTAAAMLGLDADGRALADAARAVASGAVAEHLPSCRRPAHRDDLAELLGPAATGLVQMVALAAVNTTVAAFPRCVAWAADAELWDDALDDVRRAVLVAELLRVTAASPVLPRVAASDGVVGGCPVRAGDRLVLVARDAAHASERDPSVDDPAPAAVSQLVFGAGSHACPGAGLARVQLDDLLAALAPHRPFVVRAVVDRRAALPSWGELVVRAR